MRTLLMPCLVAVAVAACSTPEPVSTAPTFFTDLKPILEAKCTRCHQAGGIGPMRLDDYATAKANAGAIAAAVESGSMPPFFVKHDGTCGDFRAAEALTDAEKATIASWASSGAVEGAPQAFTLPPLPHLEAAHELQTPLFKPEVQGGPLAAFDEYRCFALPHGVDHDAFLTGYEVLPGDARVIHHVIGFLIDPAKLSNDGMHTNGAVMQALDDESPDRAGWPCFGRADDQGVLGIDASPVDWAPGQGIVDYPAGMGVPLKKDHVVVVQVHYNLVDPAARGTSDSTKLRLRTADSVERKLVFLLPDGFLQTLFGPTPAQLPPGARVDEVHVDDDRRRPGPGPAAVRRRDGGDAAHARARAQARAALRRRLRRARRRVGFPLAAHVLLPRRQHPAADLVDGAAGHLRLRHVARHLARQPRLGHAQRDVPGGAHARAAGRHLKGTENESRK